MKIESYPTDSQKKIIWASITALSIVSIIGVVILSVWIGVELLQFFYSALFPLGVAAIVAYILDPLVSALERLKIKRLWALLIVYIFIFLSLGLIIITVLPAVVDQFFAFIRELPRMAGHAQNHLTSVLDQQSSFAFWVKDIIEPWKSHIPAFLEKHAVKFFSAFYGIFSWVWFFTGLFLTPIYVFFLLGKKESIARHWKGYVPFKNHLFREEFIHLLTLINGYLVSFFRGQIIIALITGALLGLGLMIIGLPYAILFGVVFAILSFVPYLGVVLTIIPALVISFLSGDSVLQPILVLLVFALIQIFESLFLSPKIMGEKTGLHPMTVILSVLLWSLVIPGLFGPILAIPLTATLRVLLGRYLWNR